MDKSRQQFEEWFNNEVFSLRLADKKLVNCYWDAWEASRESLEIELPRRHDEDDEYDYFAMGYNSAIEGFTNSLISNGVKIKND